MGWDYVCVQLRLPMGPLSLPQTILEKEYGASVEWYRQGRILRKACPSTTLLTTNPKWIILEANPGLRVEKLADCRCIVIVSVARWYRTRLPMHYDHFWSVVRSHISSNNSWFIHRGCPEITSRDSSEAGETWREMALSFSYEVAICFHTCRVPCCKILKHGTDNFTSEGSRATDFYCPKNPLSSAGFDPETLGSNCKHVNH
jgi:hypothetical protein